jgi:hypothetical protein
MPRGVSIGPLAEMDPICTVLGSTNQTASARSSVTSRSPAWRFGRIVIAIFAGAEVSPPSFAVNVSESSPIAFGLAV